MHIAMAATGAATGALTGPWVRAIAFRLSVAVDEPDRTTCPGCGHPVFARQSWWHPALLWSGRCPGCRRGIGMSRGATEIVTACLLGAVAGSFGPRPELVVFGWLAVLCVALVAIDLVVHRLPDRLTLPSYPALTGLLAAAAAVDGEPARFVQALLAGTALAAAYLGLVLVKPGQLGIGDVKLAGLLGLGWVGWDAVLYATALAFALCAVVGVVLLAARRATLGTSLPLGPFMAFATFVVLLVTAGE